jgi:subtilase-type serine protease
MYMLTQHDNATHASMSARRMIQSRLSHALGLAMFAGFGVPVVGLAQTVIGEGQVVDVPGTIGSPWNVPPVSINRNDLIVNGTLRITDGGVVNNQRAVVWGLRPDSPVATVIVDGAGSTWNSRQLRLAESSSGPANRVQLIIRNGGTVNSERTIIGDSVPRHDSTSEVTVSGRGSTFNTGYAEIGRFNYTANVNVLDGGLMRSSGKATVGFLDLQVSGSFVSRSRVLVSGEGSAWHADAGLSIVEGSQVVIADGGTLTAPNIELTTGARDTLNVSGIRGGGTLAIGGAEILRFVGSVPESSGIPTVSAATAPGHVRTQTIDATIGHLLFNHTSSDYVFDAQLTARPSASRIQALMSVFAGTTRLTADSSTYRGDITIHGGALLVDGALGGTVRVNQGGMLGGVGRLLGAVTIHDGGRLAPGGSIGTLRVGGDLTFQPDSIYEVDVTPQGLADLVSVGGNIVINGGSVISIGQDSGFKPFTEYTILTAAGQVSGRFANATSSYAFLNAALTYEPSAVKLVLRRNDVSFASVAETANQRAAAAGAESTRAGTPVWDALVMLADDQARVAFDAISGELHASGQTALIEDALAIQQETLLGQHDRDRQTGSRLWVKAAGGRARTDAGVNAAEIERDRSNVLVGADMALGEYWRVGALLGVGQSRNEVDARASRSESDHRHGGLYATVAWGEGWNVRAGAVSSRYDIESRRRMAVEGLADELTAEADARVVQYYGEMGYALRTKAAEVEPFLRVSQIRTETDGFQESGGVGALRVDDVEATTRYATLGVRFDRSFSSGWYAGGALAWRRASGDLTPISRMNFEGGQQFLVEGAPVARNATLVTATTGARLTDRSRLDVSYIGQISSEAQDHGALAALTINF